MVHGKVAAEKAEFIQAKGKKPKNFPLPGKSRLSLG